MKNNTIAVLLFFLSLSVTFVNAQKNTSAQTGKNSPIKVNADRLIYDEKTKKAHLSENVKITYEGSTVTSKEALLDTSARPAVMTGSVKLWQEGNVVTGERMEVFYNERKAIIYNNVRALTYNAKEKDAKNASSPLIITCNKAEVFWITGEIYAYQNVKAIKGSKRAYGDQGYYSKQTQLLTLTGNAKFEEGNNNWMTAPQAVYDLNTDTFTASGGVEAEIETESEKNRVKSAGTPVKPTDDKIITPRITPLNDEILIPSDEEIKN